MNTENASSACANAPDGSSGENSATNKKSKIAIDFFMPMIVPSQLSDKK
jgi:hypothetical protein